MEKTNICYYIKYKTYNKKIIGNNNMKKSSIEKIILLAFLMLFLFSCQPESLYYKDGEVRIWMENDINNGVNIVVLGDGYIEEDLYKETGDFDVDVNILMEFLFSKKPFSGYINKFNVYVVYSKSVDRGADDTPEIDSKNTVFNSTFNASGIQRLLVVQNHQKVEEYILKVVDSLDNADMILISVNDERYGGSGGTYAVFSQHDASLLVAFHELGHSFGGLADEYVDPIVAEYFPIELADSYPNVSRTNDLDIIKWKHFIGLTDYSMVGAYEGGFYRETGIWRPQEDCVMRSMEATDFCAPCRESIVKQICEISGETYSFQDFLEKDKIVRDFSNKSFFNTFAKKNYNN